MLILLYAWTVPKICSALMMTLLLGPAIVSVKTQISGGSTPETETWASNFRIAVLLNTQTFIALIVMVRNTLLVAVLSHPTTSQIIDVHPGPITNS